MASEILGALQILKSASDTAKSLIKLRDIALVRSKAVELQGQILEAQQIALDARAREETLVSEVRELKDQIAKLEQWDADNEAYILREVGTGAFAYLRKPGAEPTEPPHWLCTNCFGSRRKSILQYAGRTNDRRTSLYACPVCKNNIQVSWSQTPEKSAEDLKSEKVHVTSESCPYCAGETRLLEEKPHPTFGEVGILEHTLQCIDCERKIDRTFDPKKGYT